MDCGYVPPSVNRSKIEKDRITERSSQAISCPSWAVQPKLPKAPICWKIVPWALHFAVNWKLFWKKVFHPNVCYIRRLDSKSSPSTSRNKWVLSQGYLLSICCTVVHLWNSIILPKKIRVHLCRQRLKTFALIDQRWGLEFLFSRLFDRKTVDVLGFILSRN